MTHHPTQPTPYASAQETASVIRPATADEAWLHAQLDRLDPHRLEAGGAGDTPALIKLVFELRHDSSQLQSEAADLLAMQVRLIQAFEELVAATKEVLRISDRKHDAWDWAKAALAKVEGGAA